MLKVGLPQGVHSKSFLPMRKRRKSGDWLNFQRRLGFESISLKSWWVRDSRRKCSWSGALE